MSSGEEELPKHNKYDFGFLIKRSFRPVIQAILQIRGRDLANPLVLKLSGLCSKDLTIHRPLHMSRVKRFGFMVSEHSGSPIPVTNVGSGHVGWFTGALALLGCWIQQWWTGGLKRRAILGVLVRRRS